MKATHLLIAIMVLAVSRASAAPPLERELFNIFSKALPVPTPPSPPKRPYPTYSEALESIVAQKLPGMYVCKSVSGEVLQLRAKEAAAVGWAFCEVRPEDDPTNDFGPGTTKYKLVVSGKPGMATVERADLPASAQNFQAPALPMMQMQQMQYGNFNPFSRCGPGGCR